MPTIDYPVRTPPAYWPVAVLLVALCLGALAYVLAAGPGVLLYGGWTLLLLVAILALIPPIYLLTTREYRVRGTIRVGLDAIEVPGARGEPLRFDPRTAELHLTRVTVRYTIAAIPVADLRRGTIIDLRSGPLRRRLSTLTLVEPEHTAALLDDLERVRRGEPPRGPSPRIDLPPPPPRDHSDLERQLERELAALD